MDCGYGEKIILCFYCELPGPAAEEVKKHAETCASCAAGLAVLKQLAARLESFAPEPPLLNLPAPAAVPLKRRFTLLRTAALAGAFAAGLALVFQPAGKRKAPPPAAGAAGPAAWNGDIDSGLDNLEYGIYCLEDDILYSSPADFDYDIEIQKQKLTEKSGGAL